MEQVEESIDPLVAVNTNFPVSIAIDSQSENSIARRHKYRAANYEILAQLPAPDHGAAQIAFNDYLSVISKAMGVWDAVGPRRCKAYEQIGRCVEN